MIPAALGFLAYKKYKGGSPGTNRNPTRVQYNNAIQENNRVRRLIAEHNAKLRAAAQNAEK